MTKEPKEEVGTVPKPREATIHLGPNLMGIDRGSLPEMLFNIAMTPLLRIEIRGIGREPCHFKVGMRGYIVLDDDGSMRIEAIPDHDHWARDVPLEVAQGRQHIRGPDGMLNMTRVDRAGQRQANHRG